MIYLDNAATTFPKPECVYQMVDHTQRNLGVNIGRGSYSVAAEAMSIVDETRYLMAKLVGIDNPNNVVLTSSATIAANEVIYGLEWDGFKTVYISPFEHNAIARPLEYIRMKYGVRVLQLPFNRHTHVLDEEKLRTQFAKNPPDYVIANHVSNVTGTVIPIKRLFGIAKEYGAIAIADASQSIGLLEINMETDNIDYLIFAGHKNLYASWGIGGFISRNVPTLKPVLAGGTGSNSLDLSMGDITPVKYEPASPNIIAIASLNASLKWLAEVGIETIATHKRRIVEYLIKRLRALDCTLYLPGSGVDHTSVVSFNIEGYSASDVGSILSSDYDIAVRTGYHCAPYIHTFLNTLDCGGTVRISIGYFNSSEDVDALCNALEEL